jgi:hypothetical protein
VSNTQVSAQVAKGQVLAEQKCGTCHAYPAPELLDKKTWNLYILPRMGFMSGVLPADSIRGAFLHPDAKDAFMANPLLYAAQPLFSPEEWYEVRNFYLRTAPDSLTRTDPYAQADTLRGFRYRFPDWGSLLPGTTLVQADSGSILIADAQQKKWFRFDTALQLRQYSGVPEGAIARYYSPEGQIFTCMGSFSPTDLPNGQVWLYPDHDGPPRLLIDSLRRPVHSTWADLDGDGLQDVVIAEFGKWQGSLNWWKNAGDGHFLKKNLLQQPGATRSVVCDMDGDGDLDVVALFAQGNECIYLFRQTQPGVFEAEQLLQFPPSYGSVYFDLVDVDGDQRLDILHVSGDNADFPPIVKPYQGIRVFKNQGKKGFKESLFLSMPGAYGARIADFDGDGDLDIAAISFFPDFERVPDGGFVFFEKINTQSYRPHRAPPLRNARWIVIETGDPDLDGDPDLLLGALLFEVPGRPDLVQHWQSLGIPFVWLQNQWR